jgi:hypothetical protein
MGAAWVAGTVRARALLSRRVGAAGARRLAGLGSVDAVIRELGDGPYGRELRPGLTTAQVEAAIGRTLLWQMRVLAGWLAGPGVRTVRLLAAWFEIVNTVDHARRLAGAQTADGTVDPYRLGALATAWPRLAATTSLAGLRAELARSIWGDPGAEEPAAVAIGMAVACAARVAEQVPRVNELAAGAAALQVARERFLTGRELTEQVRRRAGPLLGPQAMTAEDLAGYTEGLRPAARWALADLAGPDPLPRAETAWWQRVEREAASMVAGAGFGQETAVGCVAALAADARRLRGAVQLAALGDGRLELFDAAF